MASLSTDRPNDFEGYWDACLDELAKLPPAPEVEEHPIRSTDFATAYTVRLTSIGPYRIFAYLSIPHSSGPLPARYYLPRYGSVVEPIPQGAANGQRSQYVTLSVGVRGQREANQPFAASFPGMLTQGIDDPQSYVYRSVVADCCRGVQYLASRPEVDTSRVAAIGNDLALITAALCMEITHVVCAPALFYATADLASRIETYPLEEVNDYLRSYPYKRETVRRTLSYFDLRWFGTRGGAKTLLMGGADGELLGPETLEPLVHALEGKVELHKTEHSSYKDGLYVEEWLARQFVLGQPVLPEHWR